jgi:alkylation response protein AidB-like acyl-CoA dehydrogenase
MKLALSVNSAVLASLALALEGSFGMLAEGDDSEDSWHEYFLGHWASRIGGGTDQIQRNIIGERVLGLPAEPRVDKDVAFRDLTRSSGTARS